ncbi:discoidin, CUB and LCCL domain-containing protein 1 [Arapaima gigas]
MKSRVSAELGAPRGGHVVGPTDVEQALFARSRSTGSVTESPVLAGRHFTSALVDGDRPTEAPLSPRAQHLPRLPPLRDVRPPFPSPPQWPLDPEMCGYGRLHGLLLVFSVFSLLVFANAVDNGCGHWVQGPESGVLSSRNYPSTYPNNSRCEMKIRLTEGHGVIFRFGDLDIEGSNCQSSYVQILYGHKGSEKVMYCAQFHLPEVLESNEVTIQFYSGHHISGRGFLLTYARSEHKDLITCLDTGNSFSTPKYRKYCPAGCKDVNGDVSGDISQGYRHTSVLCKAAVHAGVIADEQGGYILVEEKKGLSSYPATKANGVQSTRGSLSEKLFTFLSDACKQQERLWPVSVGVGSGHNTSEKTLLDMQNPNRTQTLGEGTTWISDRSGSQQWMVLDLGEKKTITDIITTGYPQCGLDFYVKTYKIEHKEKNRWKTYMQNNNSEKVFVGNTDCLNPSRNSFQTPIVARYLRVVPLIWHQNIAITVDLLGCPYIKENSSALDLLQSRTKPPALKEEVEGNEEEQEEAATTSGPVDSQADLVKLTSIVAPTVLLLILLLAVACICKVTHRKKRKDNGYASSEDKSTGCWKQVKRPFMRQPSTEFTISYSAEQERMQKLDLVTSAMAVEYQQPPMIGIDTVSRKGSTFRPMDTEAKEEAGETITHYDYLQTANQYALPLTSQEPEYATPIIERHAFRKDCFTPDPSYSVPGAVLSKTPSFKAVELGKPPKTGLFSGDYQTPQVKTNRPHRPEGVYDRPKVSSSLVQNGSAADYQRPQVKPSLAENYSTPRDCISVAISCDVERVGERGFLPNREPQWVQTGWEGGELLGATMTVLSPAVQVA